MSIDFRGLREQIFANASMVLDGNDSTSRPSTLSNVASCSTLVNASTGANSSRKLEIIIHGDSNKNFTAMVMVGLTPAIEGASGNNSPEAAMRKLLLTTCELLDTYTPRLGGHHLNIHGGGVLDKDLVRGEFAEAMKKPYLEGRGCKGV